jgi:fucose permease
MNNLARVRGKVTGGVLYCFRGLYGGAFVPVLSGSIANGTRIAH